MQNYWQKEIETASRDQITAWQNERLCNTVEHVYENVELYRRRMDEAGVKPGDIKTIEDITKLPFTCKQDLRDTYPYGMFAVPMSEVVRLHASSGTTGKQIVVGYTKEDLEYIYPMATDSSPAVSDSTAERSASARPRSPYPPEIPRVR